MRQHVSIRQRFCLWLCFLFALSTAYAQTDTAPQPIIQAEALAPFQGDFAAIQLDGKRYYLHHSGRVIVDELEQQSTTISIAIKDGAYGAINRMGDVIADFQYDRISYNDYFAILQLNGKYGAVDSLGKQLAAPIYDELRPINGDVMAAKQQGKWGLLALHDGSTRLGFTYDDIQKTYFLDNYVEVKKQGKKGLCAIDGQQELLAPLYEDIQMLALQNDTLIAAKHGENTQIFNRQGKVLATVPYVELQVKDDLIWIKKDNKWGWMNAQGKVLVAPKYDESSSWQSQSFFVSLNGQMGAVAPDGKELIPCTYDRIALLRAQAAVSDSDAFILVGKAGKQGLFSCSGMQLLPLEYDYIAAQQAGNMTYLRAMAGTTGYVFDLTGKELLRYKLSENGYYNVLPTGTPMTLPLIDIIDGERTGIFDLKKKSWLLKPVYTSLRWQAGAFILAEQPDEQDAFTKICSYFTAEGEQLIPPTPGIFVDAVDSNFYVVGHNEKGQQTSTLYERSGKVVYSKPNWRFDPYTVNSLLVPDSLSIGLHRTFQNGLLKVSAADNLFIDRSGKEQRFKDLSYVGDFYKGRAIASQLFDGTERVGIIDTSGRVILPMVYQDIKKVYDSNLLRVVNDDKYGLIDQTGKIRIAAEYDYIDRINSKKEHLFFVRRNGKMGVMDQYGQLVIPLEYENIQFRSDVFILSAAGKKGFAKPNGTIWIVPKYDDIQLNNSFEGKHFPALVQEDGHWSYIDPSKPESSFFIIGQTKL